MFTINKTPNLFLVVVICSFFLFPSSLLCAQKGKIILLYGTSCAGKSTLAEELRKKLPNNFFIVKKAPLVNEKIKRNLEQFTGKRPENKEEIFESIIQLPKVKADYLKEQARIGLKETFIAMKPLIDQGANIIFDICTTDSSIMDFFEGYDYLTVLVYAPLNVLLERLCHRVKNRKISEASMNRKKCLIINSYCDLYDISLNNNTAHIDTLSLDDIPEKYLINNGTSLNSSLENSVTKLCDKFHLKNNRVVNIIPVKEPDILIKSDEEDISKSYEKLRRLLYPSDY